MIGVDVDELAERLAEKLPAALRAGAAPDERPLYSVKSLAERLSLSERTVQEMLAAGTIPSFRLGTARRIDPAAVDEYLAAQRAVEDAGTN